jgi:hypothetical protein
METPQKLVENDQLKQPLDTILEETLQAPPSVVNEASEIKPRESSSKNPSPSTKEEPPFAQLERNLSQPVAIKKWSISTVRKEVSEEAQGNLKGPNAYKNDIVNDEFKGEKNKFVRRHPQKANK